MVRRSQDGFSLAELMISMSIMLLIAGAATTALLKMTSAQATIWNRTQMHSGIRGASDVLQQEVGQAGRVALPSVSASLAAPVGTGSQTVAVIQCPTTVACTTQSVAGMFVGEKIVVDGSTTQETVTLTAVDTSANTVTAVFANSHTSATTPIRALGAFATGVVTPLASPSVYSPGGATFTFANGSDGSTLKLYGDINADGNMVYVEYTCDTAAGNLYRNSMAWDAPSPSAPATASQILLSNVTVNPDATPCFTYQTAVVNGVVYVTDVAITLTVQTQLIDPVTKQFQTETKALLNVSPRNVFNAWTVASLGLMERIQPMPPAILALLP
jgi:prepilin-type N-terminal cleavage/methylation domain-containing protein